MDSIGMVVDVWRSDASNVLNTGQGTTSAQLREGVMRARAFAVWRRVRDESQGLPVDLAGMKANVTGSGAALLASCRLGTKERASLEMMAERCQLSGRGIMRALAVARTIADMEECECVSGDHLMEALGFRKNDQEPAAA
jgi:magnesium chelatase family protein